MPPDDLELRGPVLTLRYPRPGDAPALFDLARDEEVTRFFSWGPYERVEQAQEFIASLPGRRERGEALDFVVAHPEAGPIGMTGLSEIARRDRRCIVGTWFGRAWWGSGVNAESKAIVARLAFEDLGMHRLAAYASTENARSQRALEKLGFVREGVLRSWHRHGERYRDVVMYALLRHEWERSPLAAVAVEIAGAPPAPFVVG